MEKLLPQCFQKMCTADTLKQRLVWERLNPFPNKPRFLHFCRTSPLKTLLRKEKLLVSRNFSFSCSVFLSFWRTFCQLHQIQNCRLQTLSIWTSLKFVVSERHKLFFISIETNPLSRVLCKGKYMSLQKFSIHVGFYYLPNDNISDCMIPIENTGRN